MQTTTPQARSMPASACCADPGMPAPAWWDEAGMPTSGAVTYLRACVGV